MTTQKQVSVRISAQGGKQLKAELKDIGVEGSRAFKQVGDSARAQTANVQNAAYQVGDFFVQVGGGVDPMRAAAQQLPQLLGGLGMFGAVAGAAFAAAVPLAGMFLNMGEGAVSAEERVKALAEAVSALDAATRAASADPLDLVAQYGGQGVAQAKEALEIERQIAKVRAERDMADASMSLGSGAVDAGDGTRGMGSDLAAARVEYEALNREIAAFGDIRNANDQAAWDALQQRRVALDDVFRTTQNYRNAMIDFADGLGLVFEGNEEALQAVNNAMLDLGAASTLQEQTDKAAALRQALFEASEGGHQLNEEGMVLLQNLTDAQLSGLALARIDYASGIGAGADEAARMAGNLADAANAWLAARSFEQQPGIKAMLKYGGRGTTDARPIEDGLGEVIKIAVPGRGRSGGGSGRRGGGGGGADPLAKEAEKWFNATRTAAEKYADELAELDKLQAAAKISSDTYARSVTMIGEKYLDIGDAGKFWKDINGDLKESILDLGVDGAASFDDIARSIKRAALEALLFKSGPLAGMFGGGGAGGGLGGWLSGLLSFEGGGYTGSGARSGGMDGRGGFLAMLHPEEHVVDPRRGGGMGVNTKVEVVPSKYFDVRVAQVSSAFDQQAARAQQRAMPRLLRDQQARGLK